MPCENIPPPPFPAEPGFPEGWAGVEPVPVVDPPLDGKEEEPPLGGEPPELQPAEGEPPFGGKPPELPPAHEPCCQEESAGVPELDGAEVEAKVCPEGTAGADDFKLSPGEFELPTFPCDELPDPAFCPDPQLVRFPLFHALADAFPFCPELPLDSHCELPAGDHVVCADLGAFVDPGRPAEVPCQEFAGARWADASEVRVGVDPLKPDPGCWVEPEYDKEEAEAISWVASTGPVIVPASAGRIVATGMAVEYSLRGGMGVIPVTVPFDGISVRGAET